jgi:hypothetical protein
MLCSTDSFAKILSAGNRELLRIIAANAPGSLDEAGAHHRQIQSIAQAENHGRLMGSSALNTASAGASRQSDASLGLKLDRSLT